MVGGNQATVQKQSDKGIAKSQQGIAKILLAIGQGNG